MKFLDKFLQLKNKERKWFQIIIWWEIRRILYNIIILIAGILSIIIILLAMILVDYPSRVQIKEGEDFIEPFAIPMFLILSNIFYTLGWLIELFIKRSLNFGPKMFKIILFFTFFRIFFPSIHLDINSNI